MFPLQYAQWLFISIGLFSVDHHFRRVLDRDVNLALLLVRSRAEVSMRRIELAEGSNISIGAAGKYNHAIRRVHRYGVDVAGPGINVEPVIVLIQSVGSLNDAFRFSRLG